MAQVLAWLSALPLWSYYLLFGFLALILARKSQVDEWANAHPRVAGVLKTLRGVGLDPWIIIQGLCLIVFGKLPDKPVLGIKPKLPPGLGVIVLALTCGGIVASPALVSCSASPAVRAHVVESAKALAFNEAVVALELLDQAEATRLDAIKSPTDAQVVAARARVAQLVVARDLLKEARAWLAGESDVDGPAAIQQALVVLRDVVKLIKAEGGDVPAAVERALELVP